jgi:uncharacterized membrane protein YqaE (UPF0057 family)
MSESSRHSAKHRCYSRNTAVNALLKKHMDILRIILAILLPPLGVFLQVGFGLQFWVNILLTLLGYVPGIILALYVIIKVK